MGNRLYSYRGLKTRTDTLIAQFPSLRYYVKFFNKHCLLSSHSLQGGQHYPYFTDEESETGPRDQESNKETGAEGLQGATVGDTVKNTI